MVHKLEYIFNLVKRKSKEYNANNENPDGQKFWQPIKKLLSQFDNKGKAKWKPINKKTQSVVMKFIPEYQINALGDKLIIEPNHFIIQTVRIPLTEKGTIRKIIQIALNIGQFQGRRQNMYLAKYIKDRTKLEHYIYKSDIKKLSDKISDNIIDQLNKLF